MKKILLSIKIILATSVPVYAQNVAINNDGTLPNASALLDIKSTSKGLLIPRMTSAQRSAIASPATGLMIFQTDGTAGFYYYNGSTWTQLGSGAAGPLTGWATTGNGSTDSSVNFIGTMDSRPLIGKVNNQRVLYFSPNTTNTILGFQSGINSIAQDNTLLGYKSGYSLSKGDGNIFIGHYAGYTDTTGRQNLFLGNYCGYNNTSGSYNQFIGFWAGQYNTTGTENLFSGYQAGQSNTTGSQNFFEGDYSGNNNTTGSSNHFEGYKAGAFNTTGSNNQMIGYMAGFHNTTGYSNMMVGYQAGTSNTTGYANVFMGPNSGNHNIDGSLNCFVGYQAGLSNTSGSSNCFFGTFAGVWNQTGINNVFIGNDAGNNNTTGSGNLFIGYGSGYNSSTTSFNHYVGYEAGYFSTGTGEHFEGYQAGFSNTTGNNNHFSGYNAGYSNATGSNNTCLGFQSGYSLTGSSNVMIGNQAGYNETGSNKLYISNTNTSNPLIYGDFSQQILKVNGSQEIVAALNPTYTLIVANTGSTDVRVAYDNTASGKYWYTTAHEDGANTSNGYFDFNYTGYASGRVFQLLGTGNAWLAGTLTQASDVRLKEDIEPLKESLNKVMKVNGFSYKWKDKTKDSTEQIGFIAQQIEKIFPQLVKTDDKGFKSVAYTNMVPVLLEAIKEQQKEIEDLKSVKEELAQLKAQVAKLQQFMNNNQTKN